MELTMEDQARLFVEQSELAIEAKVGPLVQQSEFASEV